MCLLILRNAASMTYDESLKRQRLIYLRLIYIRILGKNLNNVWHFVAIYKVTYNLIPSYCLGLTCFEINIITLYKRIMTN